MANVIFDKTWWEKPNRNKDRYKLKFIAKQQEYDELMTEHKNCLIQHNKEINNAVNYIKELENEIEKLKLGAPIQISL